MAKVQILRAQAYSAGKVSGILDEATRVPEASKHVTTPKPPKWLWGSRDVLDSAVQAHQTEDMQLVHMADGTVHKRKRRKDARCLVAGVASHPLSMMELNQANANGVQAWVKDTLKWLKARFGKNLKGCLLHLDESHPHLHFFVVGDAQRLHPGLKNEVQGKTRIANSDARMTAHKDGLKAFLDDYHAAVGQQQGLVRSLGSKPAWRIRDRGVRQQVFDLDKRITGLELQSKADPVAQSQTEAEAIASIRAVRNDLWDKQEKVNRPTLRF
jgi:hypothetical protein